MCVANSRRHAHIEQKNYRARNEKRVRRRRDVDVAVATTVAASFLTAYRLILFKCTMLVSSLQSVHSEQRKSIA